MTVDCIRINTYKASSSSSLMPFSLFRASGAGSLRLHGYSLVH
jgi:hypothetical protein